MLPSVPLMLGVMVGAVVSVLTLRQRPKPLPPPWSNLTWLSRFPAAVPAGGAILIVTFFVASAPMLNGVAGETKLTHVETIRVPPVGHDEPELLKPVKPAIPLVAEFLLVTAS